MNSAKEVYDYIYNDKRIRDIYKSIDERENANVDAWGHHNFNHVSNVKDIVEELLRMLNYDNEFIEEAKIAAIMHDVGAVQGKENHAERSYIYAKNYFNENNINIEHKEQVLEAIKNHSDGFDSNNIMQLALILADKLDIKYTRPTKRGLEIPGNRQYGNIENISTEIKDGVLKINFRSNDKLDKKELENFYFMKKVGNAIKSFAEKLDLKYKVYLNGEEWNEIMSNI
ncbi:MAG: HD domain-containing protein [Clostridia bacterium]|nr:HD domain-containing protein [Clostridia bacterium]